MTGFGYNINGFGVVEPSVPYILEFRIIGGGGSGGRWLYASGGGAAGAFVNHTITEPAANIQYYLIVGGGGAAPSNQSGRGVTGSPSYLMQGSTTLVTAPGGSYSDVEGYGPTYEPPQKPTTSVSGGAGVGPNGASTGVVNSGNQHTNGYYGGDSTPGGNDIFDGGVYYANYQGGGGAGHGGDGGDAGTGAFSAGAGGAGAAWHDGVMRGGGGGGCSTYRRYITPGTAAAGGSGGGGAGGIATYSNVTNAVAGTANTGGGAGGGGGAAPSGNINLVAVAYAGGSGVCVVRYQGAQRGTGGTITSSGGYTYHTFTSTGYFTTA